MSSSFPRNVTMKRVGGTKRTDIHWTLFPDGSTVPGVETWIDFFDEDGYPRTRGFWLNKNGRVSFLSGLLLDHPFCGCDILTLSGKLGYDYAGITTLLLSHQVCQVSTTFWSHQTKETLSLGEGGIYIYILFFFSPPQILARDAWSTAIRLRQASNAPFLSRHNKGRMYDIFRLEVGSDLPTAVPSLPCIIIWKMYYKHVTREYVAIAAWIFLVYGAPHLSLLVLGGINIDHTVLLRPSTAKKQRTCTRV